MYHHVHFYVKALKPLEHYKEMEKTFNSFLAAYSPNAEAKVEIGRQQWTKVSGSPVAEYCSQGQDLPEQLISGLGWRITASYFGPETQTVLLTSPDSKGVKFVITGKTAGTPNAAKKARTAEEQYDHFKACHLDRFFGNQANREGCGALGFCAPAGELQKINKNYVDKHPQLLVDKRGVHSYGEFKVFESFAYYSSVDNTKADVGTVLRFVHSGSGSTVLPGLTPVEATFPLKQEVVAYFDHWVSNVVDRKQFLSTLTDTLGFVPKVDFNAGVVAAGEAIIESTVTGNTPGVVMKNKALALVNQEQVYLPINNALSKVGHVSQYLEEIGQGIQHLASRVEDLVSFIARVNLMRDTTGQGLNFLNIPGSYYGRLTAGNLEQAGLSGAEASELLDALTSTAVVSPAGLVSVDVTDEQVATAVKAMGKHAGAAEKKLDSVTKAVRKAVYSNLYKLLKDNFSEETYLRIVKNKVLVDIQGVDVLFQIFTSPVLQQKAGDEAPFLEFIQRVCSEAKDADGNPRQIKPGCGGFGIRNFLTLFLSIEVSKAMRELDQAEGGETLALAQQKVQAFTDQLDESNPVLTAISDAMTEEGDAVLALKAASVSDADKAALQATITSAQAAKQAGNDKLGSISDRYKALLSGLREKQQALAK